MTALSILVTKDPLSAEVALFRSDYKTAQKVVNTDHRGCSAFVEGIADLDNAHFLTKYEMQALTEKLNQVRFRGPPRDRLVAAKALALVLLEKQKELPPFSQVTSPCGLATRICPQRGEITPCQKGTKLAVLLELLMKGTTMAEMRERTGWAEGGVLSGLNWDINKRKGIGYKVTRLGSDEIYSLIPVVGYTGALVV